MDNQRIEQNSSLISKLCETILLNTILCKTGINRQKKKKRKKKTLTQRQMDLGSDAPDSEPDEAEEEDPRREYPVVLLTAPTGKDFST